MNSNKHEDYITHINNNEDCIYLRKVHFPVNMRLFKTSKEYKNLILDQCNYIRNLCLDTKEGYKKPHGMSSANAGLSFNIIGITRNRNKVNEYCEIMINPEILTRSEELIESMSNCGSITLKNHISIMRSAEIIVKYFTEDGDLMINTFHRESNCLTIQHEIDHNLGILITDYK